MYFRTPGRFRNTPVLGKGMRPARKIMKCHQCQGITWTGQTRAPFESRRTSPIAIRASIISGKYTGDTKG